MAEVASPSGGYVYEDAHLDWPLPYLQPDRTKDCGFYSVAYIGHCFGLDVTAQQVMEWRAETNRHEDHYLQEVHGIPMQKPAHDRLAGRLYHHWWMGPDQREWVASLLDVAVCLVHLLRIPTMHHSVVALEAHDDGVLLMDPIYGHVVEPWDWFLGPGAGNQNAHALWSAHPREWATWVPGTSIAPEPKPTPAPTQKESADA